MQTLTRHTPTADEEATYHSYDDNADHWIDSAYHLTHWISPLQLMKQLLVRGSRILEVGAASGDDTYALTTAGYDVLGTDVSRKMVAGARRRHPDIPFQQANIYDLPFPDGWFDGFWGAAVFLHLLNQLAGLREMHRVLRPGGFGFISVRQGDGRPRFTMEPAGSGVRYDRLFNNPSASQFDQLLAQAGFQIVDFRDPQDPTRDLTWLNYIVQAA